MEGQDDWGDGSWTVDCVCGVNFDDGEEMVDCDECGVWVHTRCSRYEKSEKVFTCEKCRRKSERGEDCEGEVADSLVRMANKSGENAGLRRRVGTSREERVHVQGEVGGEGAGKGVLGAGLWRATGYVPKKFGFQYKEFDWNDGNESGGNQGGGNESSSGGALSLLNKAGGYGGKNESTSGGALSLLNYNAGGYGGGNESRSGGALSLLNYKAGGYGGGNESNSGGALSLLNYKAGSYGGGVSFGAGKKKGEEGGDDNVRSSQQSSMKTGRSSEKSLMSYCGKRKKEDSRASKDVSGKKKARAVHVERDDSEKISPSASRSVSTPSSDAKHSEFHGGKGFKVDQNVNPSGKHEKKERNVPAQPSPKGFPIKGSGIDDSKNTLSVSGQASETSCPVSTHRLSLKARQRDERDGLAATNKNSSKVDGVQLLPDHNDSSSHSAKTKDNIDLDNMKDNERCIGRIDRIRKHLLEKENVASDVKDLQNDYGSNDKMSVSCSKQNEAQSSELEDQPSLNTPATISDEELALLLHQELNSSARVPRVPRMRHAGSLPQLASSTGVNMLVKQSPSSSVGKDHGSVFKRKGKGVATEGYQNSQELQDESKNMKRSLLMPVQRTSDSARTADPVIMREVDNGSAPGVQSANKSNPPATSKQHVSSRCKSTQTVSDDETGTEIRVTRRTLPGLLSKIITKPMTYKELCDAVLPHWPHLRKNNGDPYAYSSHSQAVLDCLRSRREWARLVDRGPKSNAGRKPRGHRFDAEAPSFETGANDSNKKNSTGADCTSVVESLQDQIPKGRRQMRKRRRRLALQEGGLKNMDSDDVSNGEDSSLSSSSSEEGGFSSGDGTIQWDEGTSSNGGPSGVSASE